MNVPLRDSTHDGRAFFLCLLSRERAALTTRRMLKTLLVCHSGESRSDRDEESLQFARVAGTSLLSSDLRLRGNSGIGRSPRTEALLAGGRQRYFVPLKAPTLPGCLPRLSPSPSGLRRSPAVPHCLPQPGATGGPATAYRRSLCCAVGQGRGGRGGTLKSKAGSLPSGKFVDKAFLMREGFSQPRQGRNTVAQGGSPGLRGPHPVPLGGHPSPARAGEGTGVRGARLTHGLRRGLHYSARSAG